MVLLSSINSLKCASMKDQECKVSAVVINNECMHYPYSIKVNRCNGNCNNISNPYSKVCVPNVIKTIAAKVFDLMSWKNKTKQIEWHESCKCVCKLDPIIFNNRQKWNKDKCRCECLVNKKSYKILFGILVIVNVNVRKKQLIYQQKNVKRYIDTYLHTYALTFA